MSFLEMPNSASEESSAEEVVTEGGSPARVERLTAVRLRDLHTGRFVAAPSLVTKSFSLRGATETVFGGTADVGNSRRVWRRTKKKVTALDPKLSVTLKKKEQG
jgi:hypothetical protein